MWPWAHAAVGYLLYRTWLRGQRRRPADLPTLALAVGTQLPDLIDKTMAWYAGILPYGRSLTHTLFVVGPLCLLVVALARRYGLEEVGTAFAVGLASHPLADAVGALVHLDPRGAGFLVWPLIAPPDAEVEGLLAHLRNIEGSPLFLFGLAVTAAGLIAWARDGYPGVAALRAGLVDAVRAE
jgi:hypothetical protein